jgi:hypothetical protein
VMTAAKAVAPFRLQLLAPGANLEAIRVSNDEERGDSLLETWHKTVKGGASSGDQADAPWNAWLVSVRSLAFYRRSMWLRGMPDGWCFYDSASGNFLPDDNMIANLKGFANAAKENKLAIKALSKEPGTAPLKGITAINTVVNRFELTVPAHGITVPEIVNVNGVKGDPAKMVNGVIGVSPLDENKLGVNEIVSPGAPNYLGYGVLRRRLPRLFVVDTFVPMRMGKRDTGRRFFVTRGRRPATRA